MVPSILTISFNPCSIILTPRMIAINPPIIIPTPNHMSEVFAIFLLTSQALLKLATKNPNP